MHRLLPPDLVSGDRICSSRPRRHCLHIPREPQTSLQSSQPALASFGVHPNQEDFRNTWEACPWETDLAYATAACEQLGVPLEVVPLTKQYWDRVVSHSIGEIAEGLTPNPDVLCNSRVKARRKASHEHCRAFLEHLPCVPPPCAVPILRKTCPPFPAVQRTVWGVPGVRCHSVPQGPL